MYSPPADVDFDGALKGRFDGVVYSKAASVIRQFRTRLAENEGGFPYESFLVHESEAAGTSQEVPAENDSGAGRFRTEYLRDEHVDK